MTTRAIPDARELWEADALLCNLALTIGRPVDDDDRARLGQALLTRTSHDFAFGGADWGGPMDAYLPAALALFSDPDRLCAFGDLVEDGLPDATYWRLLRDAWSGTHETLSFMRVLWRTYFGAGRPCREHLMAPGERDALAALEEQVTIHRGYSSVDPSEWRGPSWTLDESIAHRFACLRVDGGHPGLPHVATVTVPRDHIVAFLNHRYEQEAIVLDPGDNVRLAPADPTL